MDYTVDSLKAFLEKISSDNPVPGGGSVSAYVAAMGLALLKKTLVFTLKKAEPEAREKIEAVLKDADDLLDEFLKMVNLDAEVFLKCINNKSLPFDERFEESKGIAQEICDLCHKAYKVHAKGSYLYSKSMKLDYEAAQRLIDAAFRISWENAHYGENS